MILRDHLAPLFAPELTAMRPARRDAVVEALDAMTSWETWDRLRTSQRLGVDEATRVVTTSVLGVLASSSTRAR